MQQILCCFGDQSFQKLKAKNIMQNRKKMQQLQQIFNGNELYILTMIYDDLAQRNQSKKIDKENFLLYFHQNGQWGDRLFEEFDTDQNNLICKYQFLKGIALVFKTDQKEKIKLLYKYFSSYEGLNTTGIVFNDFLAMVKKNTIQLYNYPKQGLKQILNKQQFVSHQLTNIRKKSSIKYQTIIKKPSLQSERGHEIEEYQMDAISDTSSQRPGSQQGFKPFFQQIQKTKTKLKVHFEGKQVEIKLNIQHLVKKLAKSIFEEQQVDIQTGKLSFEQFYKWIQKHKGLYDNYYGGFHNEIWQFDKIGRVPKYLHSSQRKISSQARTSIFGPEQPVFLILLHSTLIITTQNQSQREKPISVIILNGLAVKKCFNSAYGIQITHRQGYYKTKHFYFKNQEQTDMWMEHLKYFKGVSIHQKYEIKKRIGIGSFSKVFQAKQIQTGKQYAIKIINNKFKQDSKDIYEHQSSIMSVLSNPFLVAYKQTIISQAETYIVTQLVKGSDLYQYVKQNRTLNQFQAARITRQLILAVKYMHKMGIVHRDLKPQNIMIEANAQQQNIKIIDFGFAAYLNRLIYMEGQFNICVGTLGYMAPQVINNGNITFKIDNYAIGGIIYFMLSGKTAVNNDNYEHNSQKPKICEYSFNGAEWKYISGQAKDLMKKFLQIKPQNRISLQQAQHHAWFAITKQKKI